ncbi:Hypothetical protein, predicted transmembrane protein [Mycoplasmopsis agalactiae 14628]|uniref:Peptidase C1A papain C-terminal domain-containing protein n=1 Tax=Mycoplasmopsis agalactiae 14628 TaxID=1110504 RepID=I5D6B4_MYCAA|nr:C1 family peptidase [Mycoplasmopsis agalactiae]EIN15223.1 Hypothetical protein, predicted transmembrane protein [Mycoplasmopsis agalactiae 14628]
MVDLVKIKNGSRFLSKTIFFAPFASVFSLSTSPSASSNNMTNNSAVINEKHKSTYFSLRDDYILFNQYQYNTGLCWDFSATKSLETSLMLNTNEMYDFSEASITINDTNNVGGGAWFDDYDRLISNNGISYESDFKFGDLYYVPNKGVYHQKLRDLFNKHTDKNFRKAVERVDFNRYDYENIKKHIVKNGSLFVAIRGYKTVSNEKYYKDVETKSNSKIKVHELVGTGRENTHAVSIIGWDDNYKATDGSTGAWIILNSDNLYSNRDGVNFLPYNSSAVINEYSGYKYVGQDILISESNAIYENEFSNYYNSANYGNRSKNTFAKNRNIFKSTQDIKIEYKINKKVAKLNNIFAKVYQDGIDVSTYFNIEYVKNNGVKLHSKLPLKSGAYSVKLFYDYNLINNNEHHSGSQTRQIYVLDGTEAIQSNSYWTISDKPHIVFHANNSYVLNNHTPVVLVSKNNEVNFNNRLLYTNSKNDENTYFKVKNDKLIDSKVNNFLEKYKDDSFDADISVFSGNYLASKRKYHFYRLDEKAKYTFVKLYFDLDGSNADSLVTEVPFLESGSFSKHYLPDLKKENSNFLKYTYINKNGIESDLPFDSNKNKYYVTYDHIKGLRTNVLDFNYVGNRQKDNNQTYANPIIVKAIFETKNEAKVIDSNLKDSYKALMTINLKEVNISVESNGKVGFVKPTKVSYQSGQHINYGDSKIEFEYELNGKKYVYEHLINVEKLIIEIPKNLNNRFVYDGYEHNLGLDRLCFKTDVLVNDSKHIDSGKYQSLVKINNKNYSFADGKNELVYEWEILPKTISENSIIDKSNLKFDDEVLYSFDKLNFKEYKSSSQLLSASSPIVYFKYKDDKNHNSKELLAIDLSSYNIKPVENANNAKLTAIIASSVTAAAIIIIIVSVLAAIFITKKKKKAN